MHTYTQPKDIWQDFELTIFFFYVEILSLQDCRVLVGDLVNIAAIHMIKIILEENI